MTLQFVDSRLHDYRNVHHGASPLYIIVSSADGEILLGQVRALGNFEKEEFVTSYKGSKIVLHDVVQKGDLVLSNDLPETSS